MPAGRVKIHSSSRKYWWIISAIIISVVAVGLSAAALVTSFLIQTSYTRPCPDFQNHASCNKQKSFAKLQQEVKQLRRKTNAILREFGIKECKLSNSITWNDAKEFCRQQNQWELCSFSQIFPPNKTSTVELGRRMNGNHWAPISDAYNDWVQVGQIDGESGNTKSWTYIKHYGHSPKWGNTSTSHSFKSYVYCCLPI